jgi:hypothetical protein
MRKRHQALIIKENAKNKIINELKINRKNRKRTKI